MIVFREAIESHVVVLGEGVRRGLGNHGNKLELGGGVGSALSFSSTTSSKQPQVLRD